MRQPPLVRTMSRVAAASAVVATCVVAIASTQPDASASDAAARRVSVVTYNLGDTAFRTGDAGPNELAGVVHYPSDLATGKHPLILQLHGSWWSCNDKAAWAKALAAKDDEEYFKAVQPMGAWPCAKGTPPLPSSSGYGYLGEALARHGFVVVSIGANGINADEGTEGYRARAALVNKQLALWQQLAATGGGKLRGAFVDPATGRRVDAPFARHVDMTKVGTMGHSRGGKGVMWQAADQHRGLWPKGVQVKAVVPYASVYFNTAGEDDHGESLATTMPLGVVVGTCDGAVGEAGLDYINDAKGKNKQGLFGFTVHGANHNFFNSAWSPSSGNAGAADEIADSEGRPENCSDTPPGTPPTPGKEKRLTEDQERTIGQTYVVAFFRWALLGEKSVEPILTGAKHPHDDITKVDVTAIPPAGRN